MQQQQTGTQLQTLVVHRDQLTTENMLQLSQAGYSIINDSALLIFARQIPPQDLPSPAEADLDGQGQEVIDMPAVQQHRRNKK